MDFNHLTIFDGLVISLFSMVIVFLVLLAIAYMVDIAAFFINFKSRKKKKTDPPEPAPLAPQTDSRTLAIVMAALSAMGGEETRFVIRKIESQEPPLSEWEASGLRDNTHRRPL